MALYRSESTSMKQVHRDTGTASPPSRFQRVGAGDLSPSALRVPAVSIVLLVPVHGFVKRQLSHPLGNHYQCSTFLSTATLGLLPSHLWFPSLCFCAHPSLTTTVWFSLKEFKSTCIKMLRGMSRKVEDQVQAPVGNTWSTFRVNQPNGRQLRKVEPSRRARIAAF